MAYDSDIWAPGLPLWDGDTNVPSIPMGLFRRKRSTFQRWAVMFLVLLMAGSALADDSKISPDLLPLLSIRTKSERNVQHNGTERSRNSSSLPSVLRDCVVRLLCVCVSTVGRACSNIDSSGRRSGEISNHPPMRRPAISSTRNITAHRLKCRSFRSEETHRYAPVR